MTGCVLVLNGPSSSGKSTLGRALQRELGTNAVLLPIDLLWQSVHPDRPSNWALFEQLTGVLFETALAFWERGADVIVDTVFERQACADLCLSTLVDTKPILVGLYCDIAELERRELERGDRRRGLALSQATRVHGFCQYDLCLDTEHMSVEACVAQVLALRTGPR